MREFVEDFGEVVPHAILIVSLSVASHICNVSASNYGRESSPPFVGSWSLIYPPLRLSSSFLDVAFLLSLK